MSERWWRFADWKAADGTNHFAAWVNGLSDTAQAILDARLVYLATTKVWTRPAFAWLVGKKYKNLGEIRFNSGNVPHRPLGCLPANPLERRLFILLMGCTKNRNQYEPKNALDVAEARRLAYLAAPTSVVERKVT